MKVKTLIAVMVIAFAMTMMAGCAKAPQQDLDAAKAAMDAAKAAEADRYAPEQFNAVKDSLNAAQAEIEKQNGKFTLFRSYSGAKATLANASIAAKSALDAAVANKAKVKAEAEELISKVQPAMDEIQKLMKKAPRGKEGRAALEAMKSDLAAVEASQADVTMAMEKGDFLTARNKVQANVAKLQALTEELQSAIGKKAAWSR